MKEKIAIFIAIAAAAFVCNDMCAQNSPARNDSTARAVRLKTLHEKRNRLQKEIKAEDAKRNRQMSGVAPETLEKMNDRQDSICLALRSELTDVVLEIRELTPALSSQALMQQYQNIVNRPAKTDANPGDTPAETPDKQPARKSEI